MRVAEGESIDDIDFPDASEVAFDLALDALSAFIPGGAAATRSLGVAARAAGKIGKGTAKVTGEDVSRAFFGPAYPGIKAQLPKGESQLKHMFRDEHNWTDTPENRRKLEELVSRPQNYRGVDRENGHAWYSNPESEAPQLWAEVRGETITGAGINVELPIWDAETGLRKNPRKLGTYRKGARRG